MNDEFIWCKLCNSHLETTLNLNEIAALFNKRECPGGTLDQPNHVYKIVKSLKTLHKNYKEYSPFWANGSEVNYEKSIN